jgi:hypothetical protein
VRERLAAGQELSALAGALARPGPADPRRELESIVRELYATLASHRTGIKLLDRSARGLPELAALWFAGARRGLIERLAAYLETRIGRGLLRPVPDAVVAARLIIETTVFWAVHRHWDAHPEAVDDAVAEATVVAFITGALVKE